MKRSELPIDNYGTFGKNKTMARRKSIDDDQLIQRLTEVFQTYGYEGSSLGRISEATGLQRASLYHRFPKGKLAMAEAVLDHAAQKVVNDVLAPLSTSQPARARFEGMAEEIDHFYTGGKMSCLIDSMSFAGSEDSLHQRVESSLTVWTEAMADVCREAGIPAPEARQRAIEAMIRIQGSLVFARATRDTEPFQRTLERLPDLLLRTS